MTSNQLALPNYKHKDKLTKQEHFTNGCINCGSHSTHLIDSFNLIYCECDDCGKALVHYQNGLNITQILVDVDPEWELLN